MTLPVLLLKVPFDQLRWVTACAPLPLNTLTFWLLLPLAVSVNLPPLAPVMSGVPSTQRDTVVVRAACPLYLTVSLLFGYHVSSRMPRGLLSRKNSKELVSVFPLSADAPFRPMEVAPEVPWLLMASLALLAPGDGSADGVQSYGHSLS